MKMKKISDLILELEQFKDKYGDLEVEDHHRDKVEFCPMTRVLIKFSDRDYTSSLYHTEDGKDLIRWEIEDEPNCISYEIETKLYI